MKASHRHCVVLAAIVSLAGCGKDQEAPTPETPAAPRKLVDTPPPAAATEPPASASAPADPALDSPAAASSPPPRRTERRSAAYDEEAVRQSRRTGPRPARGGARAGSQPRTSVAVPSAVMARDRVVPPGRYEVKLEDSADGTVTTLLQDGEVVGQELAIRAPEPAPGGNGSWTWVDRREEPLLRVYTSRGGEVYFAVFPIL